MYWSRTGSPSDLLAWLGLAILWWAGGWLLSRHVFRLRKREQLLSGLAIGMLLFIVLSNVLVHLIPLPMAYWAAAALILASGLVAAWRSPLPIWPDKEDLGGWTQLLAFGGLLALFLLINRGLAIFDDYLNLPLLSLMATGDVPPHFYLNPQQPLAYHYGLHLFAASLVRIAQFFPWSAFDLSKAITTALTLSLAWLWFRRLTHSVLAGFAGSFLTLLGGGARWLLLLLPAAWLIHIGSDLHFLGSAAASGTNLYSVLANPWKIEGGGPFPFPFAFVNGIFPILALALGSAGAAPQMTLFLLLILARRRWQVASGILYGLVLASLALTAEHLFAMIWIGVLLAALLDGWRRRSLSHLASWSWVLLPSLVLAASMGGVITEVLRRWVARLAGAAPLSGYGFTGFLLRWPPSLLSGHLGILSLSNAGQILVALAEVGPVLLIGPWVVWWAWKRAWRGDLITSGLGLSAGLAFLASLVITYAERERDIARLPGSALFIWMILGFSLLWYAWKRSSKWLQFLFGAGYLVTILGGVTLLSVQLIAISRPQLSYFVQDPDAQLSRAFWNRLDPNAQILDPIPFRAVTLFGRGGGRAYQDFYTSLPEWTALIHTLDPAEIARAGYTYMYVDKTFWQNMSLAQKQAFQQPCVIRVAEASGDGNDFRWILDLHACR